MFPVISTEQKIYYELDISEKSEWISVTPCEMARKAFFYALEVGHFFCGPRYFTEREGLKSYLIEQTISGSGILEYRGRHYELKPGDTFFIKCDEYQRYMTKGDEWEHIWIHFNGEASNEYFKNFFENNGSCVVALSHPEKSKEAMDEILKLYSCKGVYADIMTSKVITDMLTYLLIEAMGVNDGSIYLPRTVQQATDIIKTRYAEPVTLEYLSKGISINKQYLQKLFKKHMGMSPYTYLAATRVNRAKELLRFSDMLIDEIAASVGIENTSHFIKTFKGITNMTPNAYRRMWNPGRNI